MIDNIKSDQNDGVSTRLKTGVIGLTILTCLAAFIFFILFFNRVYSSLGGSPWENQLLVVAEKLEKGGLEVQAIKIYERFLYQVKPNMKTRAQISIKLASLYRSQNNCSEVISWIYQAEIADPKLYSLDDNAKNLAGTCKKNLKSK